ncbi:hypothetical protein GE09DRAFT_728816 [Coniochaeta sp. 2T2.1]|nr:hypothetical protein GE09DRAFT_728816 [Coniochaeta sp. 2T2.1]
MAHIRPYQPSDAEAAKHICRATLPPNLASSPGAFALAPYVWTLQYTLLCPSNCFVLDDGSGRAVGYVIGTPDVFAFAEAYPRYVSEVLQSEQGRRDVPPPQQLDTLEPWLRSDNVDVEDVEKGKVVNARCMAQLAYNPRWLLLEGVRGKEELTEEYRATMHIDLVDGWQGQGWGRKMIERFVESVRNSGGNYGKGIHIGVSGENTKVVAFYERVGFRVYPGGEAEGNVWMVRDV